MTCKIGLVTPSPRSHRTAEETLGLGYLSAVLRANGYEVCIVDGWLRSLTLEEIVERLNIGAAPSIVGVSCYRSNITQAIEILGAVREKFGTIPVICGGFGPTFHEQLFIESGFTAVVRGEAEHVIVPLIQALLSGKGIETVAGVTFSSGGRIIRNARSEPIINIDQLPFPSRDTVQSAVEQKNFVHLCTSRGCEAHCSFCSIFSFVAGAPGQRRWRARSIQNIVDEIRFLYESYGVLHFKFVDDSFIEPPRDTAWTERFRSEVHKYSLPIKFRTQIRADRLNKDIVQNLKEAGWFSTSVGIENISSSALRRMAKSASTADNLAAIELLSTEKVYVQMGMILFDPYTTVTELFENLEFLKKYRWPLTKGVFTEMYAAEGTVFTKKLTRLGLLQDDPVLQNYGYKVQDTQSQRVYLMLKRWHRSHSTVYDWVIDSLTAPKALEDGDYGKVYALYRELQALDLEFFEQVLSLVTNTEEDTADQELVQESVERSRSTYTSVEEKIANIYRNNQLCYRADPNPFLGSV